jgi:predicted nuclease of restriction endonuclease-like (RecB) superfamily
MKTTSGKSAALRQTGLAGYAPFLAAVKDRILAAQVRATLSANAELVHLYWDIGRAIAAMQKREGWGAGVIPRLARDIANDMPEVKGFSERNIKLMTQFAAEYPDLLPFGQPPVAQMGGRMLVEPIGQPRVARLPPAAKVPQAAAQLTSTAILPQPVAKSAAADDLAILQQLAARIPWAHHVLLIQKVKDLRARLWYFGQTIEHGWSRNILALQIDSRAYERRGKAVHNFRATLPPPQSELAEQVLKDPYIFDFLTLAEPFRERELELALLDQVQRFLLELGQGFAFVGRQYHFEVDDKAIGVSEYQLTRALPREFRSSLPTVEEMEAELTRLTVPKEAVKRRKR